MFRGKLVSAVEQYIFEKFDLPKMENELSEQFHLPVSCSKLENNGLSVNVKNGDETICVLITRNSVIIA